MIPFATEGAPNMTNKPIATVMARLMETRPVSSDSPSAATEHVAIEIATGPTIVRSTQVTAVTMANGDPAGLVKSYIN